MSFFGSHYFVDNEIFPVGVKEYSIPVGYMHPIAFLRGIETFYVSTCMRMINKTIDVFRYDTTVLLMKGLNILIDSLGNS